MKKKSNAFLHKVEEYLYQKVKDARMYESILKMYWRCIGDVLEIYWRCIGESIQECIGECLPEGIEESI